MLIVPGHEFMLKNDVPNHDIFEDLKKCENIEIQNFCKYSSENRVNHKRDPLQMLDLINVQFPEINSYYKMQLFHSQLYQDLSEKKPNLKENYLSQSEKWKNEALKNQKECESTFYREEQLTRENSHDHISICKNAFAKTQNPDFAILLGNTQSKISITDAIGTFQAGMKVFPNDERFEFNLGNMYFVRGDYDKAYDCYDNVYRVPKKSKLNSSLYYNSQACLSVVKNYSPDLTLRFFEKAIKENKNESIFYFNYGLMHSKNKQWEESILFFDKAIKLDKNPIYKIQKSIDCAKSGDMKKAVETQKSLMVIDDIYQQFPEKMKELDKLLESRFPENEKYFELNELLKQGSKLTDEGRYYDAISVFKQIIIMDQHNVESVLGMGTALNYLHKFDEAITCYLTALDMDPDCDGLHLLKFPLAMVDKNRVIEVEKKLESIKKLRAKPKPRNKPLSFFPPTKNFEDLDTLIELWKTISKSDQENLFSLMKSLSQGSKKDDIKEYLKKYDKEKERYVD